MDLSAVVTERDGKFVLQTGYNILLIKLLNSLPSGECVYKGENKCWYISLQHKQRVLDYLKMLNYVVTDMQQPVPSGNDPYTLLGLHPNAVWEVCESAYRTLAKINHPDNGGNVEIMQTINAAWDKIKMMRAK